MKRVNLGFVALNSFVSLGASKTLWKVTKFAGDYALLVDQLDNHHVCSLPKSTFVLLQEGF